MVSNSAPRTSETILCLRVTAPTRCVRQDRWFQICFIFTPNHGGNDPMIQFDENIFQMSWNHQRDKNRGFCGNISNVKRKVRGWGYSIVGYFQGISDGLGSSMGTELESTPLDYWQNTRRSHGPPWAWCSSHGLDVWLDVCLDLSWKNPEKWWLRIPSISPKFPPQRDMSCFMK